jgi:hypothetical protein
LKPSFDAFRFPLAQVSRAGTRTTVSGQIRPRSGRQQYRLQMFRGGWRWVGGTMQTDARGGFRRVIPAGRGTKVRVYSPRDREYSPPLVLR